MAAGARIAVADCTSRGFGERDGDQGPVAGWIIDCETSMTDDFREPAGIALLERYEWVVSDGEVVASGAEALNGETWSRFLADYRTWFIATYPDIFATVTWEQGDDVPDPESTAILLQYVDEYVSTLE